jgi:hypothetical protein
VPRGSPGVGVPLSKASALSRRARESYAGMERRVPTFGNISYTHGWVGGAFLRPGREPLLVLPRMTAEFDLPGGAPGELVVVGERDDGPAVFASVARGLGPVGTLAIGARTWARR